MDWDAPEKFWSSPALLEGLSLSQVLELHSLLYRLRNQLTWPDPPVEIEPALTACELALLKGGALGLEAVNKIRRERGVALLTFPSAQVF